MYLGVETEGQLCVRFPNYSLLGLTGESYWSYEYCISIWFSWGKKLNINSSVFQISLSKTLPLSPNAHSPKIWMSICKKKKVFHLGILPFWWMSVKKRGNEFLAGFRFIFHFGDYKFQFYNIFKIMKIQPSTRELFDFISVSSPSLQLKRFVSNFFCTTYKMFIIAKTVRIFILFFLYREYFLLRVFH